MWPGLIFMVSFHPQSWVITCHLLVNHSYSQWMTWLPLVIFVLLGNSGFDSLGDQLDVTSYPEFDWMIARFVPVHSVKKLGEHLLGWCAFKEVPILVSPQLYCLYFRVCNWVHLRHLNVVMSWREKSDCPSDSSVTSVCCWFNQLHSVHDKTRPEPALQLPIR